MIPSFRAKSPLFVFLAALILVSLACQVLGAVTPTPETELPPPSDEGDRILQDTPTNVQPLDQPDPTDPPISNEQLDLTAVPVPTELPVPSPSPSSNGSPLQIGPFEARYIGPLPDGRITALFPGSNGIVWLQTTTGAVRLNPEQGELVYLDSPGDLVALDQTGALWAWDPDLGQLSSFSGTADWISQFSLIDLGLSSPRD